jgi:hypothetical protein
VCKLEGEARAAEQRATQAAADGAARCQEESEALRGAHAAEKAAWARAEAQRMAVAEQGLSARVAVRTPPYCCPPAHLTPGHLHCVQLGKALRGAGGARACSVTGAVLDRAAGMGAVCMQHCIPCKQGL